jgi:hypothetical protein
LEKKKEKLIHHHMNGCLITGQICPTRDLDNVVAGKWMGNSDELLSKGTWYIISVGKEYRVKWRYSSDIFPNTSCKYKRRGLKTGLSVG